MTDFPQLRTSRLVLDALQPQDAHALFAILSDAHAMRWYGTDALTQPEQAHTLINTYTQWRQNHPPGTRWAIRLRSNGQLIGSAGVCKWNQRWKSCALGYELAPSHQGQGYMSEALSAILGWSFQHMALNRVEAMTHPANQASIRLLQALSFMQDGHLREAGYWAEQHHDLLLFSLLRKDFMGQAAMQGA